MVRRSTHFDALIDLVALKAQSGGASFIKGLQLASQGAVQQLSQDGKSITARVQGSCLYRVRLETGRGIESHCDCPAADYQTICKHGVATALAFNMQLSGVNGVGGEEGALSNVADERVRLTRYFEPQDKSSLLDLLLDEIKRDPKRWQHWLLKADLSEKALSPAKLKTMINKALPKRDVWEWREVRAYFDEAADQFDAIWTEVDALPLDQQWPLTHHALERLNTVLLQIDDSGGHRFDIEGALLHRVSSLFVQLPWPDSEKARWLFTHLIEQPMELFPEASDFGEITRSPAFLALCEQGLARLRTEPDGGREDSWALERYARPLLAVARAEGDWRREQTLLASIAQSSRDWLALCKLCCDHHEPLEGEFWLAKARKLALRSHEQDACDEVEIVLCTALGEKGRAWQLARARFERSPSFAGFKRLRQLQHQLAWQDETLLPWVEQCFKGKNEVKQPFNLSFHLDALVRFYLELGRVQDACDWVANHKVSPELLLTLADAIRPANPGLAMTYTFRVAACHVAEGHNDGYKQAVSVLRKWVQSMGDNAVQQASFDQQLKTLTTEYKRKRNFISLVREHFGSRL